MKLPNAYANLCQRSAAIQRMNPVNAGLLGAAQEFDAALAAKEAADARFNRALVAFHASWARQRCVDPRDIETAYRRDAQGKA